MKRILIVDDKPLILDALEKALRDFAEIKTSATGEEAIHEASSRFYDLCFLDIHLPDLNGILVMKKIKAVSPKTKVAVMTASQRDDDVKGALDGGADYFIPKPFDLFRLKAIAEGVLGGRGRH